MSVHQFKYFNGKEANVYLQKENPKYQDWEVITFFYSALHLVESYCESHGIPIPKSHKAREDVVHRHLNEIEEDYLNLYTLSKNARYESEIKKIDLDGALGYYSTIESEILPLI